MKGSRTLLLAALWCAGNAFAYDQALARGYAEPIGPAAGKVPPKVLHLMAAEALLQAIKAAPNRLILDGRTPAEVALVQVGLPNFLKFPSTTSSNRRTSIACPPTLATEGFTPVTKT